jgi:hypothetical protein
LSGKARLVAQPPDAEGAVWAWFTLSVCDIGTRHCLVCPIGTGFCAFCFLDSTYAKELLRTLWTLSRRGAAAFRFLICPIATGINAQSCDAIDTKGTVRTLLTLFICNIRALNCLIRTDNTGLKARCFLHSTYTEELPRTHWTFPLHGAVARHLLIRPVAAGLSTGVDETVFTEGTVWTRLTHSVCQIRAGNGFVSAGNTWFEARCLVNSSHAKEPLRTRCTQSLGRIAAVRFLIFSTHTSVKANLKPQAIRTRVSFRAFGTHSVHHFSAGHVLILTWFAFWLALSAYSVSGAVAIAGLVGFVPAWLGARVLEDSVWAEVVVFAKSTHSVCRWRAP